MSANDRQYGGDHYRGKEYQHWDWVTDIGLHYLLACPAKYISRWRDKGGQLDLKKAIHYLDKAIEREVAAPILGLDTLDDHEKTLKTQQFVGQFPEYEAEAILNIVSGNYQSAKILVTKLIGDNR